jgi:hypothetical protein
MFEIYSCGFVCCHQLFEHVVSFHKVRLHVYLFCGLRATPSKTIGNCTSAKLASQTSLQRTILV